MSTAEETLTAPLLDGRYQLGPCIGQGGASKVYRAEDLLLGRTVAVKMMQADSHALAAPSRVRTEISVLASLAHPSLVELFDARIEPGSPSYLVMEYVEGPTLARRLHDGALSVRESAALAQDLASALHTVHAAGVVHRDVKPANVLLAPAVLPSSGFRAKLADFGVAMLMDTTRVTAAGTVVGTAAYLPPEQIRGDAPTPPGDIYALGLVLIEALTGERGFPQATGVGAVMARLFDSPQVPAQFGHGWADLLTRMTASEPADRPTAKEVSEAVARITAALPAEPGWESVAASSVPGVAAGAVAGAAVAGAAGAGAAAAAPGDPVPSGDRATPSAPAADLASQQPSEPPRGSERPTEAASAPLPLPLATVPVPAADSTLPTQEFTVSGDALLAAAPPSSTVRDRRWSGRVKVAVAAVAALLCIVIALWLAAAGAQSATLPPRQGDDLFARVPTAPVAPEDTVDEAVTDTDDDAAVAPDDAGKADDKAAEKAAEDARKEAERQAEAEQKAREAEQKAQEEAQKEAEKANDEAKGNKGDDD